MDNHWLPLLALLNLANLMMLWMLWRHIDRRGSGVDHALRDLNARVTRLEAQLETSLSAAEVRQIHERLATIEGRQEVSIELMTNIQKHMLDGEP